MMDIYRGVSINETIKIDDNTRLISQILGKDIIKSSFNSNNILNITIGDYIIYEDVRYYVNNLPNVKKNATNSFDYDITFESECYELLKTQFMDLDGNSDFYLVGDLITFIDLVITNMLRTHVSWTRGICDQTNEDYKLLSFSKNNCMQVLQKLCDEFGGEFYFDFEFTEVTAPYKPAAEAEISYVPAAEGERPYKPAGAVSGSWIKNICFTDKAGSDSGLTFKYKQGLRNIHRTTLSEKNIITRLYAFGSTKNLASDYRDHSRRLKFVTIDEKSYLEKNIDKYLVIEHTELFEDIYPHREGTISFVGEDIVKFRDSGMFNLNDDGAGGDYLLPGITAKIHFNSGDLGGYGFEISNYDHDLKEFTIIAFKDEQGYDMPNDTLKPAIGDKYVLLDIKMPQSYIDTAETALQNKAQEYLNDNCDPRVTYILEPDWRYFKTHFIELKAGDFITIEDTDLGITDPGIMTRVVELTKSLANKYKYTLKLSDFLEVQLIQRLYDEQEDLKEKIEIGYGGDIIRSRRNWKTSEELRTMVFDTDGYFDMENIRPLSVQTSMLSVGVKSTQFILRNIEIEANYQSDVSKFHASAGQLIHLSIDPDEVRTWTLSENTQGSLVDATAYYIYAKCTKEPGYTGQIIVDETQRKFDDDPTYYYFMIGVLHSVVDAVRGISLTYGQTIINGRFIRTGRITSTDGLTYFDLDDSIIHGKITFISGTTGYNNITDKPDLDIYAETTVTDDLQVQIDGKIVSWFQETDPNDWPIEDRPKYDGDMWYKPSTHVLKRYKASTNEWELIEDQKAIDAYADAATAQDTADGKRRVFTTTPTPPYDVGDLWSGGPNGELKRCKIARSSGSYYSSDWELASKYTDNTVANTKARVFRQSTQPTSGMKAGDIWFDTAHGNKPYTYSGSIWILAYTQINGGYIETGSITANKLSITNLAEIANMVLGSTGYIRTSGKDSYYDTTAGIWMGYSAGYKINIGDSAHYLKWTGSALQIKGDILAGTISGTNFNVGYSGQGNIYFAQSGISMYDVGGQTLRFYKAGQSTLNIGIGSNYAVLGTTGNEILLVLPSRTFTLYNTGTLQLPRLTNAPTAHAGDLACNLSHDWFVGYISDWEHFQTSEGW